MRLSRSLLVSLTVALCAWMCVSTPAFAAEDMGRRNAKIHGPIPLNGATLQEARRAILLGMYYNKGVKLTYEGETPNSVFARWDYRGDVALFEVRYDNQQIQVLYKDASKDLQCQELKDGVCLDGTHPYYNYMPNFTKSIRNQLARIVRSK